MNVQSSYTAAPQIKGLMSATGTDRTRSRRRSLNTVNMTDRDRKWDKCDRCACASRVVDQFPASQLMPSRAIDGPVCNVSRLTALMSAGAWLTLYVSTDNVTVS